jgi:signal transduction histidine kinase
MGMDEDTQQKLFDPYFTRKRNGSGLGLTLTQNIILNHQGSISVKSTMGEGSVFTVILNVSSTSVAVES